MSQRRLITGSSRGIGRALAEAVLHNGHRLVATPREPGRLSNLAARCGDTVRTVAIDVTDTDAAQTGRRCRGLGPGARRHGSVPETGLIAVRAAMPWRSR